MPEGKCLTFEEYKGYICPCARNISICTDSEKDYTPDKLTSIMFSSKTTKIKYIGLETEEAQTAKPGDIVITKDKGGCILVMKLLKSLSEIPIKPDEEYDYVTLRCSTGGTNSIQNGVATDLKNLYDKYTWFTCYDLMNDMSPAVGNLLPLLQPGYKLPKTVTSIKCGQNCARLDATEYVIAQDYEVGQDKYYYPEYWFIQLRNTPAQLIHASDLTPRIAHIKYFMDVGKKLSEADNMLQQCRSVGDLKASNRVLFDLITAAPYNLVVAEGLLSFLSRYCDSGDDDIEVEDNDYVVKDNRDCCCRCPCGCGMGGGGCSGTDSGSGETPEEHYQNEVNQLKQLVSNTSFNIDAWVFINGIYYLVTVTLTPECEVDPAELPDPNDIVTGDEYGSFSSSTTYCCYGCGADYDCGGCDWVSTGYTDANGDDFDSSAITNNCEFEITSVSKNGYFGEIVKDNCEIIKYPFNSVTVYKKINRCDYSITPIKDSSTADSEIGFIDFTLEQQTAIYDKLGFTPPSAAECSNQEYTYGEMMGDNIDSGPSAGLVPDILPEREEEEDDGGGDGGGPPTGPTPESTPDLDAMKDFNSYLKWFTKQTIVCDFEINPASYSGWYRHSVPKEWSRYKDPKSTECECVLTSTPCDVFDDYGNATGSGLLSTCTAKNQPQYGIDDYIEYKIMYIGGGKCKPVLARRRTIRTTPDNVYCFDNCISSPGA